MEHVLPARADMDKSLSDTDTDYVIPQPRGTPPNFVSTRKRRREDDFSTEISSLRAEMQRMFSTLIESQTRGFEKNAAVLQNIQQTNINIESSVAFLTTQNEELKKKIETLEEKSREDRKYIAILEEKLEVAQQDNRKTNFEIKNVPRQQNETKDDLISMAVNLSKSVGCTLERSAIRDIYRVRAKRDSNIKNTPIVVETTSTLVKNDFLRSCKAYNIKQKTKLAAKHLGMRTQEDTPIFVSEQLTPKAARLYFLARELVKAKTYKFCWTAYGRVYLRKEDNSPVILINSEPQIQQLINNK